MPGRTDFSRSAILRRRTPSKREKKEKKERKEAEDTTQVAASAGAAAAAPADAAPPPPLCEDNVLTSHQYSINLLEKMNRLVDKRWKRREEFKYRTAMLVKISLLIENNGWRWWKAAVNDSSTKIEQLLLLVELYQFIMSHQLIAEKPIPENDSRPKNMSNELLMEMTSDVVNVRIEALLQKLYAIAREKRLDLDYLNLITLTSRHIRSLPGYTTGEYIPRSYVDNDIEIAEKCFQFISEPEQVVGAVYDIFNIPMNERILLQ